MPNAQDRLDIMRACARKVALSDEIDLAAYVDETDGYSGADLQAVIYNANLEAIHATISANKTEKESSDDMTDSQQENSIRFVSFGGREGKERTVKSKAERAKMEKRVSYDNISNRMLTNATSRRLSK
jgi:peroxin-1